MKNKGITLLRWSIVTIVVLGCGVVGGLLGSAYGIIKKISGKIATEYCPEEEIETKVNFIPEGEELTVLDLCDIHQEMLPPEILSPTLIPDTSL